MLETTPHSKDRKKELEALLSDAELREKKARRKAVLYTLFPIIVGMLFLGVALFIVARLQLRASNLNNAISTKTQEITARQEEIGKLTEEANQFQAKKKEMQGQAEKLDTEITARKKELEQKKLEIASLQIRATIAATQARKAERKVEIATSGLNEIAGGEGDPRQKAKETLQRISAALGIDGDLSLDQLKQRIEVEEANLTSKLVSLVAGTKSGILVNYATFKEVPVSEGNIGHITLIEITQSSDLARLQAQGRKLIFESTIYVNGKKTRIAALR